MQVVTDLLLLLDAHGPETFGAFLRFGMCVAFVWVDFGNAESEEGEGEEFECFRCGRGRCDGWEER